VGSGGIAPCIPNLGTSWRWVVSLILWLLYPWGKRLDGPQNVVAKRIPAPAVQPVASHCID